MDAGNCLTRVAGRFPKREFHTMIVVKSPRARYTQRVPKIIQMKSFKASRESPPEAKETNWETFNTG